MKNGQWDWGHLWSRANCHQSYALSNHMRSLRHELACNLVFDSRFPYLVLLLWLIRRKADGPRRIDWKNVWRHFESLATKKAAVYISSVVWFASQRQSLKAAAGDLFAKARRLCTCCWHDKEFSLWISTYLQYICNISQQFCISIPVLTCPVALSRSLPRSDQQEATPIIPPMPRGD